MNSDAPAAAVNDADWLEGAAQWLAVAIAAAEERNAWKDELFGPPEAQTVVRLTLVVRGDRVRAVRDGLAALAIKLRRR